MATPVRQWWWKDVACKCLNIFKNNTACWRQKVMSKQVVCTCVITWQSSKFFPAFGSWKISYLRCFFCLVLELDQELLWWIQMCITCFDCTIHVTPELWESLEWVFAVYLEHCQIEEPKLGDIFLELLIGTSWGHRWWCLQHLLSYASASNLQWVIVTTAANWIQSFWEFLLK